MERIDHAICQNPKNSPVEMLPVSKGQPIEKIKKIYHLGFRKFGESYLQELEQKATNCPLPISWVYLGKLQSRKINKIVSLCDEIHSVASYRQADLVNKYCGIHCKSHFPIYLVVNIGQEPQKTGFTVDDLKESIAKIMTLPHLKLMGLMAIPPQEFNDVTYPHDPPEIYHHLRNLAHQAGEGMLSLGMSKDLNIAIAAGSDCLRIGTALFGPRQDKMSSKHPSTKESISMPTNPLNHHLGLPKYTEIEPKHIQPAVQTVIEELTTRQAEIERLSQPTWNNLLVPLEEMERQLDAVWGPVCHLLTVSDSQALREAHESARQQVIEFSLNLSQSEPLYNALQTLKKSSAWETLSSAQHRIINKQIQEAELAGVALKDQDKSEYKAICQKLSELTTQFSNNLLDSIKNFELLLHSKDDVKGLPDSFLVRTHEAARKKDHQIPENHHAGPWLVTLDPTFYQPFMQYADNQPLREQLYRAFIARASTGKHNNAPLITEILQLRKKQADLLGFANYAQLSLTRKMAGTLDKADQLLEELLEKSYNFCQKEHEDLKNFARESGHQGDLNQWDIPYYAEKLKKHLFDFSEEELKAYFPFDKVLFGLFELVKHLFDVDIIEATSEVSVWHKDVRFFRVYESGNEIAGFFIDPFSRPENKRGGAWMNICIQRGTHRQEHFRPVAYLICNATPPVSDKPSLMTFRDVETLFHEFGHGLQHLLTKIDYYSASGIAGVEWDAVELPSQFMENWCYHFQTLKNLSQHYQSGESLPKELFQKIEKSRTFRSASAMCRQLHFAMLDLELYARFSPDGAKSIFHINQEIAKKTTVIPPLEEDRFLCSFSHIFAGGYAAGYYSYKWAEVLSADAFSAFEEVGLDRPEKIKDVGMRFRNTILALGGSEHPMEVFCQFRHRPPKVDALLRHCGLAS